MAEIVLAGEERITVRSVYPLRLYIAGETPGDTVLSALTTVMGKDSGLARVELRACVSGEKAAVVLLLYRYDDIECPEGWRDWPVVWSQEATEEGTLVPTVRCAGCGRVLLVEGAEEGVCVDCSH